MKQMQLKLTLSRIQPYDPTERRGRVPTQRWIPAQDSSRALRAALQLLTYVHHTTEHGDLVWPRLWIPVERETWQEVQHDLAEEEYDQEAWQLDYPYETEWLGVTFRLIDSIWHVHQGQIPAVFRFDAATNSLADLQPTGNAEIDTALFSYIEWIGRAVKEKLEWFLADPDAYNLFIQTNLPNRERVGRVQRSDLWRSLPSESHFLRDELRAAEVVEFSRIAPGLDEEDDKALRNLTRDDYLRFCEVCYAARGIRVWRL